MDSKLDSYGRFRIRRRILLSIFNLGLIAAFIVGVLGSVLSPSVMAAASSLERKQDPVSPGTNAIVAWNEIALRASVQVGKQNQPQSLMYLARVQAAVYNAVIAIEGGYELYKSELTPQPKASVEAAVAAAAYTVLLHDFPLQQADLDVDYAAALAAIPDGSAKTKGINLGQEAAGELLAMREDDGLEADLGFTMPSSSPGVWQLPEGTSPMSPWISQLKPFLLDNFDQFRPGPTVALDSVEWAYQYEEVRLMGAIDSPHRTLEQTDVARFWTEFAPLQYNKGFQQIILERELGAPEAARLFAMGNLVGADALIGCFDAKYKYLNWRPAFAIPNGDSDGNQDTTSDPTWKPLIGTPPHPEYPSAHSCLTSSIAEALVVFSGTQRIELELHSSVPGLLQPTRYYENASDLVHEIINARVWGGIHYRESNVKGAVLGRKVAHWALQRYFLPEP